MVRHGGLAAASVVSLLLVTGCSAGGSRSNDEVICRAFASAISVVDSSGINSTDLLVRALTAGREAARRSGYLSARLARDLRAVTSGECNKISGALPDFEADCRDVGVRGPVWLEPYAPSC